MHSTNKKNHDSLRWRTGGLGGVGEVIDHWLGVGGTGLVARITSTAGV